jgi:hypothetical protein
LESLGGEAFQQHFVNCEKMLQVCQSLDLSSHKMPFDWGWRVRKVLGQNQPVGEVLRLLFPSGEEKDV